MLGLDSREYLLHDTIVDNIEITSDGLILYFYKGIYTINHNSSSTKQTNPCKMYICIQDFDMEALYQHIEIIKFGKYTYKEKSFRSFVDTIQKNGFRISLDYYSSFANSMIIDGISNGFNYFFKITEIQNIGFIFDH